jgi:hypothetical protein
MNAMVVALQSAMCSCAMCASRQWVRVQRAAWTAENSQRWPRRPQSPHDEELHQGTLLPKAELGFARLPIEAA